MIDYKSLILSGGDLKMINFIGCIRYIEDNGNLKLITDIVGTSAGSIMALFIALGYDSYEMEQTMYDILKEDSLCNLIVDGIDDELGICDGQMISNLVKYIITKKISTITDLTFQELYDKTNKNITVVTTNLTQQETCYFNVKNTPDTYVSVAIRASCTLPVLFPPVIINNDIHIDGGLYCKFPINYSDIPSPTLGLNIITPKKYEYYPDNFLEYIKTIIFSTINKMCKYDVNDPNIVTIEDKDYSWISLEEMKVTIEEDAIRQMITNGYTTIEKKFTL